jgi:hypothetical protein
LKYIIFEDFSGKETPILFPARILHDEMREQMPYAKVVSAGHVTLDRVFVCRGRSKELKAVSRPEDSDVIAAHFSPSSDGPE